MRSLKSLGCCPWNVRSSLASRDCCHEWRRARADATTSRARREFIQARTMSRGLASLDETHSSPFSADTPSLKYPSGQPFTSNAAPRPHGDASVSIATAVASASYAPNQSGFPMALAYPLRRSQQRMLQWFGPYRLRRRVGRPRRQRCPKFGHERSPNGVEPRRVVELPNQAAQQLLLDQVAQDEPMYDVDQPRTQLSSSTNLQRKQSIAFPCWSLWNARRSALHTRMTNAMVRRRSLSLPPVTSGGSST